MKFHQRLLLCAAMTVLFLGLAIASASAGRFSYSDTGFRQTFRTISIEANNQIGVQCEATFEGAFHASTWRKVTGSLVGLIRVARLNNCIEGSANSGATVLSETLPWHIQYEGFEGTLPNITSLRFNEVGVSVIARFRSPFGTQVCLIRSTTARPLRAIWRRSGNGEIPSGSLEINPTLPATGCIYLELAMYAVTSEISRGISTERITITLI